MFSLSGPVASRPVSGPDALLPDQRSLTRHRHRCQVHWCWSRHSGRCWLWSRYRNRFRQPHHWLCQVKFFTASLIDLEHPRMCVSQEDPNPSGLSALPSPKNPRDPSKDGCLPSRTETLLGCGPPWTWFGVTEDARQM